MDTTAAPIGRTITKEVFIKASQERVFRALSDPAELGRWLGHYAEVDLRPGGTLRFSWPTGETDTGTVVAVEPSRRLAFSWGAPHLTEVEFLLVPHDDGTLLRFSETGFGTGDDWDRIYTGNDGGWEKELTHLRLLLETGGTGE